MPLVTLSAMPPMTKDIAKVVISGLILKTVTIDPVDEADAESRENRRRQSRSTGE